MQWTGYRIAVWSLVAACFLQAGCTGTPPRDRNSTALSAASDTEFARTVALFGGIYAEDAKLSEWLAGVGENLSHHSGRPGLRFTFSILDTAEINAFSTFGNHVYVTRGLLAVASNEAEVAAVLAHEMGHIMHGDNVRRVQSKRGVGDLPFALSTDAADRAASVEPDGADRDSFSVQQEYRADEVSIRIVAAAGYDPSALPLFLSALSDYAQPDDPRPRSGLEQTIAYAGYHPIAPDRIARAAALAGRRPRGGQSGREAYLAAIDGMLFGGGPTEGYVRGGLFILPRAGVRLRMLPGMHPHPSPIGLIATIDDGSALVLTRARPGFAATPLEYLIDVWARDISLRTSEPATVGGRPAAIGAAELESETGVFEARLIAVGWSPTLVYRFMLLAPAASGIDLDATVSQLFLGFGPLARAEAATYPPLRLRVAKVRKGDNVASLTGGVRANPSREELLRKLNRLGSGTSLVPGQLIKLVE